MVGLFYVIVILTPFVLGWSVLCHCNIDPFDTYGYLKKSSFPFIYPISYIISDNDGRAVYGEVLRAIAYWDCGFASHRGHGCLSVVSLVCCQVEVSATS